MEEGVKTPLLSSSNSSVNTRSDDSDDWLYKKNRPQPVARRPFHYPISEQGHISIDSTTDTAATYNRYRYYNKLAAPSVDTLSIPDHVVPTSFFLPFSAFIKPSGKKQSSIVTIFAIWNTMMGTSLLSIPWAIQQAGFACALVIIFCMGAICLYTAYRIVRLPVDVVDLPKGAIEFPDICKFLLGRWAEWSSIIFSLITLLGGAVVYWVLMSNFLYHIVVYIYEYSSHNPSFSGNTSLSEVLCPNHTNTSDVPEHKSLFYKFWDMDGSVPLYMAACFGPLICLKSPTFFTKFNALGTLSVIYLIAFTIVKASQWGVHFEVSYTEAETGLYSNYVALFEPTFPSLVGILSLALFIHSCVLTIMRNQRNPGNNSRDLAVAYVLVAVTYLIIGITFFISFPLSKKCIGDNFLNNFGSTDLFAVITRAFLFFQMLTLFPLIVYLLRIQFMHFAFGSIYPSFKHIVVLNLVVLATCISFAIYMPKVGSIIRFSGAFAGLAYIFTLPCLAYMAALREKGQLTKPIIAVHSVIIVLGICNFFAQFFT